MVLLQGSSIWSEVPKAWRTQSFELIASRASSFLHVNLDKLTMASKTLVCRLAPRMVRTAAPRGALSRCTTLTAPRRQAGSAIRTATISSRSLSSSALLQKQAPPEAAPSDAASEADIASDIKPYDFSSISELVANPDPSVMIIDVREPGELQQSGRVPGAQNLPINSSADGLFLPAEEFEDRFGFEKPTADTEVVFYCKAGVRSRAAARVARMAGWQKVGEYPGSWLDWEKNGGQVEK